jgi:hypothetical protein
VRGLQREIEHLFGLSLDEFTSARNELARRLKKDGDSGAADEIRALGKPSVSAWTINQLSRREPAAVRDLLSAGDAVREAQKRLLREAGKPDSLRNALAKERKAIRACAIRSGGGWPSCDRSNAPADRRHLAGRGRRGRRTPAAESRAANGRSRAHRL